MKARYDEGLSETLSGRGKDFWHSVWKGIEDIARDDDLTGKNEMSLEAPRDYVVDSENRGLARSV